MARDVTDSTFEEEVLKSDKPVLVDFWAPWCGPCRNMGPIIDELAKDRDGAIKVVKLNVDDNKATSDAYGVRGIPAFMMFKDGKVVDSIVGGRAKSDMYAWADEKAALPSAGGQTAAEIKAAAPAKEKEQEEAMVKNLAGKLLKGKLGAGLMAFSAVNNGLTITGGLIVATALAGTGPLVLGGLAVAAGAYRLYNAATSFAAVQKDPAAAIKKAEEEQNTKTGTQKLIDSAVGLAFGIGVLGTATLLFGLTAPLSGLAAFGVGALGVKMGIGGFFSTVGNGFKLLANTFRTSSGLDAKLAEAAKKLEQQMAKTPAPAPAPTPAATPAAVTPSFEKAADPAAAKAPETPAKTTEIKPPAPPQA